MLLELRNCNLGDSFLGQCLVEAIVQVWSL